MMKKGQQKPTNKKKKDQLEKCDLCGGYHEESITHGLLIKGKKKYICQECADSVHGLV